MQKNDGTRSEPVTCAGNFLFSDKASSTGRRKKGIEKFPKKEPGFSRAFFLEFPDLKLGNDFMETALDYLSSYSRFSAVAIMIDAPSGKGSQSVYAAQAIKAISEKYDGIWGGLDQNLFGCFFPQMDSKAAVDAAKEIQEQFEGKKSLSFGIASYPMINFDRMQIMKNAYKALDHAGFFGPASVVSFDAVSLNISADKLYQNGDLKGAITELEIARKLDPCDVNILNSLGVCFGMINNTKTAFELFKTAIWLDPKEVMPVYNIGYAHLLEGETDAALKHFLKAYTLYPKIFEVVFQLGTIFLDRKQMKRARPFLEKAVEYNPESILACQGLGHCYKKLGMIREAVNMYKKAVKANPNDAASLSELGILYDRLGENNEIATVFCKQSIEIQPDNGLYRQRMGRVLMRAGSFDDAIEQFKSAEELGCDCAKYFSLIDNRKTAKAS